jgi:hypothetical protein
MSTIEPEVKQGMIFARYKKRSFTQPVDTDKPKKVVETTKEEKVMFSSGSSVPQEFESVLNSDACFAIP